MVKIKKIFISIIILISFIPALSNAINVNYGNTSSDKYYTCSTDQMSTVFGCVSKGPDSLQSFVKLAFNWVAGIIGSLALLGLIWAAFTYITSNGNPDSLAKAKDIIVTSISSILIIIFSYAFFSILGVI